MYKQSRSIANWLIVSAITILLSIYDSSAASRVKFDVERLPQSNFVDRSVYVLTIWAETTEFEWDISSLNIAVEYNGDVMYDAQLLQVNEDLLDDSYSVTVTPNQNQTPAWFRLNVLKFQAPYVRMPANSREWLARVRLSLKGNNPVDLQLQGLEDDGIDIKSDDISTQIFNGQTKLNFGGNDQLSWSYGIQDGPQIIAHCNYPYFRFNTCREVDTWYTPDPISFGAARWFPEELSMGQSVVRFQYDFDNDKTPTDAKRIHLFNKDELKFIGDDCRCVWQAQTYNKFQWAATTTGGRIHFETDPQQFGGEEVSRTLAGITFLASVDSPEGEAFTQIKDSTICGSPALGQNTTILFNNTDQFYQENLGVKWTTSAPHGQGPFGCGDNKCIDFRSIFHHELGHYLGLGHSMHQDDLMTGWGLPWNYVQVAFTQCDADGVRRLYSPEEIGEPPVNFRTRKTESGDIVLMSSCDLIDGVKIQEQADAFLAEDITLEIHPTPIVEHEPIQIRYMLTKSGYVMLNLYDLYGRHLVEVLSGFRDAGTHTAMVADFPTVSGIIVAVLEHDGTVLRSQSVVVR